VAKHVLQSHTCGKPDAPPLPERTVFAMALCCGLAVANIYYNQPMLALIEQQYQASNSSGLIPTATQLGYALGLFLLVPLGDLMERRRLIVVQFLVLSVTLVLAALAPNPWTLVGASLLLGIFATVAQQIVPFAATLSPAATRGKTIGKVMSGLLCGILLSRVLSGFIASHWGWRTMFWVGSPLAIVGAIIMGITLPRSRSATDLTYSGLLASLAHLWTEHRELRQATFTQAALFASFISFWTILSLHLAEPRLAYGAGTAGLFGIIGAVGVLIAPVAGHIADSKGPHFVIGAGAAITVGCWVLFGVWPGIAGLIIGVVLLDIGVQGSLISNQHLVYALGETTRSRINTVFMGGMFVGGSLGSVGATIAWHRGGWWGTCLAGMAFAAVALVLQGASLRRRSLDERNIQETQDLGG
jgi:predicted MFS family arabinose efflux permease